MFRKIVIALIIVSLVGCNQTEEKVVSYPNQETPDATTSPVDIESTPTLETRTISGSFSSLYTYFGGHLNDIADRASCSAIPYSERVKSFNNTGFVFGEQLTLKDSQGSIIGVYTMSDGVMIRQGEQQIENLEGKMVTVEGVFNFNCEIKFQFTDIKDSPFYQLSTSRKSFTISKEDLISKKWNIPLEF